MILATSRHPINEMKYTFLTTQEIMDPSMVDILVEDYEGTLTQFLNDIAFNDTTGAYISETKNLLGRFYIQMH